MSKLFGLLPWFIQRRIVLERDRYVCQYCGSIDDLHIDHIWPKSKGGRNDLNNLITACRDCNLSKGGKTLREWIVSMQKDIKQKNAITEDDKTVQKAQQVIVLTKSNDDEISENILSINKDTLFAFIEGINGNGNLSESNWTGSSNLFSRSEFKTFMNELEKIGIVKWRNEQYPAQGRIFTASGKSALIDMANQLMDNPKIERNRIIEEAKTRFTKVIDDEFLDAAIEIAKEENSISASMLQRKLRIGYNRASRIIDVMEQKGIIGAYGRGGARRSVLLTNPQQDKLL